MHVFDKWIRDIHSCFAEGAEAFDQGKSESDNPYQQDTVEYAHWLEGFTTEAIRVAIYKNYPEIYLEGQQARQDGRSLGDNPYDPYSVGWEMWCEGYNADH